MEKNLKSSVSKKRNELWIVTEIFLSLRKMNFPTSFDFKTLEFLGRS